MLAAGGVLDPATADDTGRRALRAAAYGRTAARVWGFPLIDDADPSQWQRCLDSLLADGLAQRTADGTVELPR